MNFNYKYKKMLILFNFLAVSTFSYCAVKESDDDNFETINVITSDLFKEIILPFLHIDDSTPQNLVSSIKQLISFRRISKAWNSIMLNDEEIIKFIQENKINVNVTDKYGTTALHLAARDGDLKLVLILMSCKANANLTCSYKFVFSQEEDLELLVNRFPFLKGIDIQNNFKNDLISRKAIKEYIDVRGMDIPDWLPLHDALYNENIEIAKILCEFTASCNNHYEFRPGLISFYYKCGLHITQNIIPMYNILNAKPVHKNIKEIYQLRYELHEIMTDVFMRCRRVHNVINDYLSIEL